MKNLNNKVALVTGTGSGIEKAIALIYAKEGAKVVVSDIDEKGGNQTVAEIKAKGGEAFFIKADTAKPNDHKNLVEQIAKQYGDLHITCNDSGIGGSVANVADYTENLDRVISINLSGVFYALHYQIPTKLTSGRGSIVNITSILGAVGTKNLGTYVAAKHGVVGLTQTAALEYADKKIGVNAVGPRYINAPMPTKTLDDKSINSLSVMRPIGKLGTTEEVAELVLWLSSVKPSFATGSYYTIDGGCTPQ